MFVATNNKNNERNSKIKIPLVQNRRSAPSSPFTKLNDDENLKQRIERSYEDLEKAIKTIPSTGERLIRKINFEPNRTPILKENPILTNHITNYNNTCQSCHPNNSHACYGSVTSAVPAATSSTIFHEPVQTLYEPDERIHVRLPNNVVQPVAPIASNQIDLTPIFEKMNNNYENLLSKIEKLKSKTKQKTNVVSYNEVDLSSLHKEILEMGRLIDDIGSRRGNDSSLYILLEKERKKHLLEKEKLSKSLMEQIELLKIEFEKSRNLQKEYEIRLKIIDPLKIQLEKQVKILISEKKQLEADYIRSQQNEVTLKAEVDRIKLLLTTREKDLKISTEKIDRLEKEKISLHEEIKKYILRLSKLEAENIQYKGESERIRSDYEIRIRELKEDIRDLKSKISSLNTEIENIMEENYDIGSQLKDEKSQKEKILIEKMNFEFKIKEISIEVDRLKQLNIEIKSKPPSIIKELIPGPERIIEIPVEKIVYAPPIEKIVEVPFEKIIHVPVEKIVYSENTGLIAELNIIKEQNILMERDFFRLKGDLELLQNENRQKIEEINVLRKRLDELMILKNNEVVGSWGEVEELRRRLVDVTNELHRQQEINGEKNNYLSGYINSLLEKISRLENMINLRREKIF